MRTLLRAARWCAFLAVATDALVAPRTVATTRRDVRRRANPDFGAPQRPAVTRKRYESLLERRQKFPGFTKPALLTLGRVLVPSVVAAALGVSYYDNLSAWINENWLDASSIRFLSSDEIQFIPSFLTVISLLFSILAGNAFTVSEAKSLLEQMALVCAGRPFYKDALRAMKVYIKSDLRRLDVPPADLVARSPSQDPLESIMYLTSVGVPSVVYETVRDLRKARGYRLGAMQRKFPSLGIALLYVLAILELAAFPLLGAGTAVGAPQSIFNELWRTSGGAFNVDVELTKMVRGLVEELDARATGAAALEGIREMPSDGGAEDAVRLDELRAEVADLEARLADPSDAAHERSRRFRVFGRSRAKRRDLAGGCSAKRVGSALFFPALRVFGRSRAITRSQAPLRICHR
ncbi:hypothetical protein JL721_10763 [Aureococcus anophagefferens]|nr:hypothetical protein JL721_10763 [Aureococcus anophagefferens]